nr:MAG: capsid protein [Circoviridae sp.]
MVKPYPYNKSAYYAVKYGYPSVGAGKVKGAASKIQRVWRKNRQRMWLKKHAPNALATPKYGKRIKIPNPRSRSLAFQGPHVNLSSYVKMGTLYVQNVSFPQSSSSAARINTKYGANLTVKGIRFARTFERLRFSETEEEIPVCPPVIMHWAVVQLKEPKVFFQDWKEKIATGFFRTFDDSYDRIANFVDNNATSTFDSTMNLCKMNPDGNFNILTHRRKMLTQKYGSAGLDWKMSPWLWHIDTYMKLNKTFTYSDTDQVYPDNPLFEVYWYQTVTPTEYPIGKSDAEYVATFGQNTVYFSS